MDRDFNQLCMQKSNFFVHNLIIGIVLMSHNFKKFKHLSKNSENLSRRRRRSKFHKNEKSGWLDTTDRSVRWDFYEAFFHRKLHSYQKIVCQSFQFFVQLPRKRIKYAVFINNHVFVIISRLRLLSFFSRPSPLHVRFLSMIMLKS